MFDNKEVAAKLAEIVYMMQYVPAHKVSNNVVFVCNKNIQCLINELGMGSNGEQNKIQQFTNLCKQIGNSLQPTNKFFHHVVYRPQIKILIFPYYIGMLIRILINVTDIGFG